ncbi:hypothetical protein PR048_002566 [Dryococelus australis]|uniref:Uncharacterized protein n=1 Tax=Dryococelus australis TaxID=614101 RepID=A0ABQ9IM16_9NEOP|nr:hypothetical protein PR048_002566 [Dryococelus australis]
MVTFDSDPGSLASIWHTLAYKTKMAATAMSAGPPQTTLPGSESRVLLSCSGLKIAFWRERGAERFDCSPATKTNRVQSPAGSLPDFCNRAGMQGWLKREIPEKTCRPAASSGIITTCENPGVTRPRGEHYSPCLEASPTNVPPQNLHYSTSYLSLYTTALAANTTALDPGSTPTDGHLPASRQVTPQVTTFSPIRPCANISPSPSELTHSSLHSSGFTPSRRFTPRTPRPPTSPNLTSSFVLFTDVPLLPQLGLVTSLSKRLPTFGPQGGRGTVTPGQTSIIDGRLATGQRAGLPGRRWSWSPPPPLRAGPCMELAFSAFTTTGLHLNNRRTRPSCLLQLQKSTAGVHTENDARRLLQHLDLQGIFISTSTRNRYNASSHEIKLLYPFLDEHLQADEDIISYLPCEDSPYGMPAFANDENLQHMQRDCVSRRLEQLLETRIIPDVVMDNSGVDEDSVFLNGNCCGCHLLGGCCLRLDSDELSNLWHYSRWCSEAFDSGLPNLPEDLGDLEHTRVINFCAPFDHQSFNLSINQNRNQDSVCRSQSGGERVLVGASLGWSESWVDKSWVELVLSGASLGRSESWVERVLDGASLGWSKSWVKLVLGGESLKWSKSWVKRVLGGASLGWREFVGWMGPSNFSDVLCVSMTVAVATPETAALPCHCLACTATVSDRHSPCHLAGRRGLMARPLQHRKPATASSLCKLYFLTRAHFTSFLPSFLSPIKVATWLKEFCTSDARLHHRSSKLDPRSDLRSTQKNASPSEFRAGLEIEIHGGSTVSLLASHQGDPGSIPGRITPYFSHACRTMLFSEGFLGDLPFPSILALLHNSFQTSTLALKTSMLRAVEISSLNRAHNSIPNISYQCLDFGDNHPHPVTHITQQAGGLPTSCQVPRCTQLKANRQAYPPRDKRRKWPDANYSKALPLSTCRPACLSLQQCFLTLAAACLSVTQVIRGRSGLVVRLLASHLGEPGSIRGGVTRQT